MARRRTQTDQIVEGLLPVFAAVAVICLLLGFGLGVWVRGMLP